MRPVALPSVLLVVTLMAGAAAAWPEASEGHGQAQLRPGTAVLSARRLPGLVTTSVADVELRRALGATLDDPALGPARDQSCLSVKAEGRVVFERHADQPLIPASNLKLLTATAVLSQLGPHPRLRTEVRGSLGPGGVVTSDLWLVGGGDPLLATADYVAFEEHSGEFFHTSLEELADRVVAAGVHKIQGRVVGDESRYDSQRYLPSWSPGYWQTGQIGPQSALTVNDNFAQWKPQLVVTDRPATNAAAVFTALLKARGVLVAGPPAEGVAPPTSSALATIDSPPLRQVVGEMLLESDNLSAELLTKELGRRMGGQGTTAAGVSATRAALTRLGFPVQGLVLVDGSGLDRSDRATCRLLVDVIERQKDVLVPLLPVANETGTLADEFVGSPAAGRLRAKTGSLAGVAALSGVADGRDQVLSFALLANGLPNEELRRRLWERVGSNLVSYPVAPSASDIGPLPGLSTN